MNDDYLAEMAKLELTRQPCACGRQPLAKAVDVVGPPKIQRRPLFSGSAVEVAVKLPTRCRICQHIGDLCVLLQADADVLG